MTTTVREMARWLPWKKRIWLRPLNQGKITLAKKRRKKEIPGSGQKWQKEE